MRYLNVQRQVILETVAPKFEKYFRDSKFKINVAYGGRGAGAKSWSVDSLIVQRAHREKLKIAYFREIQQSLKESSYQLIQDLVNRLGYEGWEFQHEKIISPAGSVFIFRGLKDMRAASQVKSYEGFDIFRVEEAAPVSHDSWMMLLPTLRKKGAQMFITFNPESEADPVMTLFVNGNRPDCQVIYCEPEGIDNPWWHETTLQAESDALKQISMDEWLHVYGGQARAQGYNAVMSRVLVDQAMKREINDEGQIVIGCDISDYGDDYTTIYKRKGLKLISRERFRIPASEKIPGEYIANRIFTAVGGSPSISISLDSTGIGTSARDFCRKKNLKVVAVNYAQAAIDKNKYANLATEMWFNFRDNILDNCQLISDNNLRQELGGRLYSYDSKGRYILEPKEDFKKRLGRSPDDADGCLLCFYNPGMQFDDQTRAELRARRGRR